MATQLEPDIHADEEAFRTEVQQFLAANFPAELKGKANALAGVDGPTDETPAQTKWREAVGRRGWGTPTWPKEYGGGGLTKAQAKIVEQEFAKVGAYNPIGGMGVMMFGPTLLEYGSEKQKQEHIPPICRGEIRWCQGYSEPNAGSDLANLQTFAEDKGDHYIVNGQKTWTTLGQHADMIFCLVRTDPDAKKQEGISFLLIDMKTPGITVRPIIMLDEEHEVNEVFFDNVKVPVDNLIGEENRGWTYAKYLLGHERTGIARVGNSKRELAFLKRVALQHQKNGKPLLQDPVFGAKVAALEIELLALEITVLRVVSSENAGKGPGPEASLLKIKGTQIQQMLTELMVEAVGPYAQPFDPSYLEGQHQQAVTGDNDAAPLAPYYFNYRKTSIYGGSNEIQRNIISQMILGV